MNEDEENEFLEELDLQDEFTEIENSEHKINLYYQLVSWRISKPSSG